MSHLEALPKDLHQTLYEYSSPKLDVSFQVYADFIMMSYDITTQFFSFEGSMKIAIKDDFFGLCVSENTILPLNVHEAITFKGSYQLSEMHNKFSIPSCVYLPKLLDFIREVNKATVFDLGLDEIYIDKEGFMRGKKTSEFVEMWQLSKDPCSLDTSIPVEWLCVGEKVSKFISANKSSGCAMGRAKIFDKNFIWDGSIATYGTPKGRIAHRLRRLCRKV